MAMRRQSAAMASLDDDEIEISDSDEALNPPSVDESISFEPAPSKSESLETI